MAIFNNRPQIIGFNGQPVGNGGLMGNQIPVNQPSTMPMFPTGGIMDRDTPLNPPDTGLMALRRPSTPELDAYKSYLKNAPTREDNQLNKWGKLLSGISGVAQAAGTRDAAGGIKTGLGLMDRPYLNKMQDYNEKGGRLKELSDLEYRTLSDEDKKAYQQFEMNLKIKDQLTKELKAASDIKLNDSQMAKIADEIQNGRKRFEKDTKSGIGYIVDLTTGTRQSVGEFAESAAAEREGKLADEIKKLGVQHSNAIGLENARFGHDTYLAGLNNKAKEDLEKLKDNLSKTGMNETQKNAAFEGAFQETVQANPGLVNTLFTRDPSNGNLVPKPWNKDDKELVEAQNKFNDKLGQRVNARRGTTVEDTHGIGTPGYKPRSTEDTTSKIETKADNPITNRLTSQELQTVKTTIADWNKSHPNDLKDDTDPAILEAVAGKLGIGGNTTVSSNVPASNIAPVVNTPSITTPQTGISQSPLTATTGESGLPPVNIPTGVSQSGISQTNLPPVNIPSPIVPQVQPQANMVNPGLMGNPYSLANMFRSGPSDVNLPSGNGPVMLPGSNIGPAPQQPSLADAGRGIMNNEFLRTNPKNIQEFKDMMTKLGNVFPDMNSLRDAWNQFRNNAIENMGNSPLMGGSGTRQGR